MTDMSKDQIPDLVLGGSFTPGQTQMFSAASQFTQTRWVRVPTLGNDPNKVWLIREDHKAQPICYCNLNDKNSRGFGGSTLRLRIYGEYTRVETTLPTVLNGTGGNLVYHDVVPYDIELPGPWSSNEGALREATGLDLSNKFDTWGCIGKGVDYSGNYGIHGRITDLIYFDTEIVEGTYNRIEDLAKKMSDELNMPLYFYRQSYGGSSTGPVNFRKDFKKEAT